MIWVLLHGDAALGSSGDTVLSLMNTDPPFPSVLLYFPEVPCNGIGDREEGINLSRTSFWFLSYWVLTVNQTQWK